jgi:hypothetical protein
VIFCFASATLNKRERPVVGDPRDTKAYQIAITFLGLALAVAIAGTSWVAAEHECVRNVPVELWFVCGAAGGVFVGALLPFVPRRRSFPYDPGHPSYDWSMGAILGAVVLVAICVAATILGRVDDSLALYALAVTVGGVLLGLPIPFPGRTDR